MPARLSLDLRERFVESFENGSPIRQAAHRFSVSPSAAIKLMQRVETIGGLVPEPSAGSRPLLLEPHTSMVATDPDTTLAEIQAELMSH